MLPMTLSAAASAMPAALEPFKRRARDAYEAAADRYDDPALGFWARTGERTIARLDLQPGMHILDLASGTGASAIPAAQAVGPDGRVVAVDIADRMLELGREKARRAGLDSIEWVRGDMATAHFPAGSFDVVVCVFGVSMAPDMPAFIRSIWRLVRPGGRLAITTWGPRLWAPMYDVWRDAVLREWPQLGDDFHAWDRLTIPTAVARLLGEAGIPGKGTKVVPGSDRWPLRSAARLVDDRHGLGAALDDGSADPGGALPRA